MRNILTPLLFFVIVLVAQSQDKPGPILARTISVSFTNEKVTTVLHRIGQQAGFSFSYNASIIPDDQVASIEMNNKTVEEILNELFKGSMTYKEKSNHLILTRVPMKQSGSSVSSMILSGYVENAITKEKISDASVYEKQTITSVVSDQFGFFRLRLEMREGESLSVSISKKDFNDTTITIEQSGNQYLHVSLKPVAPAPDTLDFQPVSSTIDTVSAPVEVQQETTPGEGQEDELMLPYESDPHVQNIRDTLHRLAQVSLLPFIGTNGHMSGNVINDYSFNFFGGYSLGTRQIELGGFFNVDRGDVSWLQIAGFGNMVGGNSYGVQAAGFFNVNGGETKAVQGAGFVNVNFGDFQGVQMSGFANINRHVADGVLAAGFMNYSGDRSYGAQFAGFMNVHNGDYKGPQIAGAVNIARGTIRGTQISGLYNYGHKVYGTQIGFINHADSLTGIPIGFISFVNRGYHKIELSADEVFYANLSFRTGVRKFYNILSVGFKPEVTLGTPGAWTFGYGLGSARKLNSWLFLNIDITSQHINEQWFTTSLNLLNKLHLGLDFQVAKKLSLYVGGTFNVYLTQEQPAPFIFPGYSPRIIFDNGFDGSVNMKVWYGGKVAIRLL